MAECALEPRHGAVIDDFVERDVALVFGKKSEFSQFRSSVALKISG